MKRSQSVLIALCCVAVGFMRQSAPANAQQYAFTRIAAPDNGFTNADLASINNNGMVAFRGSRSAEGGVYVSDGAGFARIISTSEAGFLYGCSINSDGYVAFFAQDLPTGSGYYKSNGSVRVRIDDRHSNYFGFSSINASGTVAYPGGSVFPMEHYLYKGNGGPPTLIANTSGPFSDLGVPTMNDSGMVSFLGYLKAGGRGIYRGSGGPLTTIVGPESDFTFLSNDGINNDNQVIFHGTRASGLQGLYVGNGGSLTTIADTSGPYASISSSAEINDSGAVVFPAALKAGGAGLFNGPDPVANKVLLTGDTLFGRTVTQLSTNRECLNESGQIAFRATLSNGTNGVYRADPLPSGLRSLSGVLMLEGVSDTAATVLPLPPVTFEFRNAATPATRFVRILTPTPVAGTSNVTFALTGLPTGDYTVWIKSPKTLAVALPANLTAGDVSGLIAVLSSGDCDSNNVIDLDDLGVLALAFNAATGDPLYNARADLNLDGSVDLDDLGLLALNFNANGDP